MTLSIWRLSHLVLAIVTALFLLLASVTGIILAVEPISQQTADYVVKDLDEVSLGTAVEDLKKNYDEVFSLEVEPSDFVKASVLTKDLEAKDIYIDPKTGKQLGEVTKQPAIFSFATALHRSLFLKSTGRFFVGLLALLLFFIVLTGMFLLIKRQGGIKGLFSKVQKDYFEMRYHVVLSRWLFIPITIIALSGVYLSAEKFGLLPDDSIHYQDNSVEKEAKTYDRISAVPFFKNTTLDQIRKVEFPFSEEPEDYFKVSLQNKEVKVNQQTGAIVSSASYPLVTLLNRVSMTLHTGRGSVLWSVILLLGSASLLFFMYSGFAMALKRRKKVSKAAPMPDKDEAELVILVGSESGTTSDFARQLYNALTLLDKKVFLTELNQYGTYAKARHLIVLTATYGEGEPTSNARKFETLFSKIQQPNSMEYSVVGFGSLEYPDYCQFGITVNTLLQNNESFEEVLTLYKINDANPTAFKDWAKRWGEATNIPIWIEPSPAKKKKLKQVPFAVLERTDLNVDDTFLLRLKPKKRTKFTSGDLLAIFPEGTEAPRYYSIAKIGREILLSVKKYAQGRGSSFLYDLKKGEEMQAAIDRNPNFHFPRGASSAVLIANGTGIAPFLGMLQQNKKTAIHLFWGGRTEDSSAIYNPILKNGISENPSIKVNTSFSREREKAYVQHIIGKEKEHILETLETGGTLMLCGSLAMQHGVLDALENILADHAELSLDELQFNEQLKMDCY